MTKTCDKCGRPLARVGGGFVEVRAVISNQQTIDDINEAIEDLEEKQADSPWLGLEEIIETLKLSFADLEL